MSVRIRVGGWVSGWVSGRVDMGGREGRRWVRGNGEGGRREGGDG